MELTYDNTSRMVRTPSATLHINEAGAPDAPALILLHGWTLDRRMWAAQHGALSSRFQMVTLDRRGFEVVAVALDEIEKAGGSLRCCVGEIY